MPRSTEEPSREREPGAGTGERARDAALAAVPLAACVAAIASGAVGVVAGAVALGAVGAVLAEALAVRYRGLVRRGWSRPAVRAGAVAGAIAVVVTATVAVGPRTGSVVVSAAAGGLGGYLVLLLAASAVEALG